MAGKKKFNILIVPPSSGETVQFNLPQVFVSVAGSILVIGVFLFGFLLLDYVGSKDTTEQLADLRAENAFLQSRLAEMKSSMATFGTYLHGIEQTEENIRLVFGFPDVDPAERALGIGGFPSITDTELDSYEQVSFETEAELEQLMRRVSFERENFNLILDSLESRKVQLDHTPSIKPTQGYYSSSFGMRKRHPITGVPTMHRGVDFSAPIGTPVIAPADGKVISVRNSKTLGRTVVVDHGYGVSTVYGHLHKEKVSVGQVVKRGEIIALVGATGLMSTGPHLHYEVHVNGQPVNPMKYIWDYDGSILAQH